MDADQNPYAPGAGVPPPELAGRGPMLEDARVALVRTKAGRHAKGQLMLGLRGVGKTVLLNHVQSMAADLGFQVVAIEAREGQPLAEFLAPALRRTLLGLSAGERGRDMARRALAALTGFAKACRLKAFDMEFGIETRPGEADSGHLETDLTDLLLAVAEAARAADGAVAVAVDEVQYLSEPDLAALIVALHRVSQKGLPLVLFGAGLPQLAGLAGEAKSYAERLFDYPAVGSLARPDVDEALRGPARAQGVEYDAAALDEIFDRTKGYPYFIQEWGKHAWNAAAGSPITAADAREATGRALRQLDHGFFRVRFDRLTPREKDYMAAMARLGAGPHRSGDIAAAMGKGVTSVAKLRDGLIRKGMIYSPAHGDTAFTVPMFDGFMARAGL